MSHFSGFSSISRPVSDGVPLNEQQSTAETEHKRVRSDSDLQRFNLIHVQSQFKETPEKWRSRLWPPNSVAIFCKLFMKLKPPNLACSNATSDNVGKNKFHIGSHVKGSQLPRIVDSYENLSHYSKTFLQLLIEETRESLQRNFEESRPADIGQNDHILEKYDAEVVNVYEDTACKNLSFMTDAQCNVAQVTIATTSKQQYVNQTSSKFLSNEIAEFSGGDLVVLYSSSWPRALFGIVQPWDPDGDMKVANAFDMLAPDRQNSAIRGEGGDAAEQVNAKVLVNLLLCMSRPAAGGASSSSSAEEGEIGGYATPDLIGNGAQFSMSIIGNVITAIRECQAVLALPHLHPNYLQVLLNSSSCQDSSALSSNNNSNRSSRAPSPFAIHAAGTAQYKSQLEQRVRSPSPFTHIACPDNISSRLWEALVQQFNESQLRAIASVCVKDENQCSVSLLQGPPGTGKTKTILGIVAVILAGGLQRSSKKSTKIVAGASLMKPSSSSGSLTINPGMYAVVSANPSSLVAPKAQMPGRPPLPSAPASDGKRPDSRPRILICAPSNAAIDEIVYRIVTQGVLGAEGARMADLSIVRIGHTSRDEYQKKYQNKLFKHTEAVDRLSREDKNIIRVVEKVTLEHLVEKKRRGIVAQDGRMPTNAAGATWKMSDFRKELLERADIVCATLSGAGSQPILEVLVRITGYKFDAVIVDEAAQAAEPTTLIPFKYNPQAIIMVGDPCQLPAIVFSSVAKECRYGQSLFQRLYQIGCCPTLMLETQYRMHPAIAEFPSLRYYNGRLQTDTAMVQSRLRDMPYHRDRSGKLGPFVFHNVAHGREHIEGNSISNLDEAQYVLQLYLDLSQWYPQHNKDIGIIVPYRAQRRLITQVFRNHFAEQQRKACLVRESNRDPDLPADFEPETPYNPNNMMTDVDVEISTVDGFQGREKSIVIFSCVRAPSIDMSKKRSAEDGEAVSANAGASGVGASIGFLKEWQRLNVAITRAKYSLWIVGHKDTLNTNSEWRELLQFVERNKYEYAAPLPQHLRPRVEIHRFSDQRSGQQGGGGRSGSRGGGRVDNRRQADDRRRNEVRREQENSRDRGEDRRDVRGDCPSAPLRAQHHQNKHHKGHGNEGKHPAKDDSRDDIRRQEHGGKHGGKGSQLRKRLEEVHLASESAAPAVVHIQPPPSLPAEAAAPGTLASAVQSNPALADVMAIAAMSSFSAHTEDRGRKQAPAMVPSTLLPAMGGPDRKRVKTHPSSNERAGGAPQLIVPPSRDEGVIDARNKGNDDKTRKNSNRIVEETHFLCKK